MNREISANKILSEFYCGSCGKNKKEAERIERKHGNDVCVNCNSAAIRAVNKLKVNERLKQELKEEAECELEKKKAKKRLNMKAVERKKRLDSIHEEMELNRLIKDDYEL